MLGSNISCNKKLRITRTFPTYLSKGSKNFCFWSLRTLRKYLHLIFNIPPPQSFFSDPPTYTLILIKAFEFVPSTFALDTLHVLKQLRFELYIRAKTFDLVTSFGWLKLLPMRWFSFYMLCTPVNYLLAQPGKYYSQKYMNFWIYNRMYITLYYIFTL